MAYYDDSNYAKCDNTSSDSDFRDIRGIILTEAGLSYLYLGVQLPDPSWGNMIAGGRTYLAAYPWMVIVPGIALMITVLGFNFLGDGLRDVLDPKQTR